jgi:autotransporter-associated beta strand protein
VDVFVLRFLLFCVLFRSLNAATYTWNNASGGAWTTNTNWTPNGFPNAVGDVASLPPLVVLPVSVTVSQDITIGTLAINQSSFRNYTISSGNGSRLIFEVNSGSSQITNAGDLGTISLGVLINNPLIITATANLTCSGIISDNGSGITMLASGQNITFSAANSYTGPTLLSTGTLALAGSGSIGSSSSVTLSSGTTLNISAVTTGATLNNLSGAGSIALGSKALTVSQSSSTTYSGTISGTGTFRKAGGGSLTLSGSNLYTGTTTVENGTLIVTGSILTSPTVTVNSGATLKGNATFSDLSIQGTLQPGISIGRITAASLTQAAGSTLAIEFNGSSTSLVAISEAATISSEAVLSLIPDVADYLEGQVYTFLMAGTLNGSFNTFTLANGNLGAAAVILLPPANNSLSFVISSASQQRAPISVTSSLATWTNRAQMGYITQIQDERYVQQQACSCALEDEEGICEECNQEPCCCGFVEDGEVGGIECCREEGIYHPYFVFNNSKTDIRARSNTTAGFEELWSGLAGVDFYPSDRFVMGIAGGYTRGRAQSAGGNAVHINCDNFTANGYFQWNLSRQFYLDGGTVFGYAFYDSHRDYFEKSTADYQGYEVASQLRFLYLTHFKWLWARPYVSGSYYLNEIQSYSEKGSVYSKLMVGENRFDFVDLETGVYFWAPIRCMEWTFTPELSFAYVAALLNKPIEVDFGTVISGSHTLTGQFDNVSGHYWKLNGGLSIIFDDCTDFFFRFSTVFDSAYNIPEEYTLGFQMAF